MKRPHEEFGSTLPCAPPEINAAKPIAAGVAPTRRRLAMPFAVLATGAPFVRPNRRGPRGLRRASGRIRSRSAPRWRQTGRRPGRSPASHSPPAGRVCDTGSPQPRQPRAADRAEARAHGRRRVDGAAGRCAPSRRRRRGRTGGRRPAAGLPQRRRPLPNRPRNRAAAAFRPARVGMCGSRCGARAAKPVSGVLDTRRRVRHGMRQERDEIGGSGRIDAGDRPGKPPSGVAARPVRQGSRRSGIRSARRTRQTPSCERVKKLDAFHKQRRGLRRFVVEKANNPPTILRHSRFRACEEIIEAELIFVIPAKERVKKS